MIEVQIDLGDFGEHTVEINARDIFTGTFEDDLELAKKFYVEMDNSRREKFLDEFDLTKIKEDEKNS